MKKILYALFFSLFLISSLGAQNIDDVLRFNKRELTGTARSLSMANAFGALGGDLSAISINPAGIAIYRTSEFAFTPSISLNQSKANYTGLGDKDDKFAFPLNQIGGVTSNRPLREKDKGLISTHFGLTYNRTADFNENTRMLMGQRVQDFYDIDGNPTALNTLLNNIVWEANGFSIDDMSDRAYFAYETYLIDPIEDGSYEYFSQYEDIDADGNIFDRNVNGITQYNIIEREGYSGEYGFTFGANISHILMLGTSINFQSYRFEQTESFREVNTNSFAPTGPKDVDYFDAYNKLSQKGFGINGKFGLILNLHPIRLGASIHSPTFMEVDEEYYSGISSYLVDFKNYNKHSTISEFTYNYRTPYRVQGSAAFVLGKFALLSFDYEMTDHTSSKFTSKSGYATLFDQINKDINEQMRITHDFKAGIEVKPVPFLALRAGAAYFDSPIKKEFVNVKLTKWMATTGIGIRNKNFFFDVAYAYKFNKDNYYLNTSEGSLLDGLSFADPVKLEYRNHQASFTFGWKF